jgi:ABC-2 type transport system permease protein
MGFRTGASLAAWLAVAGTLILFTVALTWLAVIAGLSAKTVDGASAFSLQQPVGADIWIALAWLVGILAVAYGFAIATYRRRIS